MYVLENRFCQSRCPEFGLFLRFSSHILSIYLLSIHPSTYPSIHLTIHPVSIYQVPIYVSRIVLVSEYKTINWGLYCFPEIYFLVGEVKLITQLQNDTMYGKSMAPSGRMVRNVLTQIPLPLFCLGYLYEVSVCLWSKFPDFLIHRSLSSASFTISWSGNFLNDVLYALINGAWVEIMFWMIIITNTFYQAPWNCFSHSLGRLSFTRLA